MTLLVVSDQHLGAGAALGRALVGESSRLADQERSWRAFCTTAAEQSADVLHCGDVFHSRRPAPAEMRAFQSGLDILREAGSTLLVALGNHDRIDRDAPTGVEAASAGYDVHVYRGGDVDEMILETEDGVVGFLPWSPYSDARAMSAALMVMAEALAERGARILIAHWTLSGSSLPSGLSTLELAEPILDSHRLAELFGATISGHIHKRQVLFEDGPLVAHAGPLTRTGFGEAGIETGAWEMACNFHPHWFEITDRRLLQIEVDVRGGALPTDVLECEIDQHQVRDAIVRVRWHQTADQVIDADSLLELLASNGAWKVDRLEPVIERVQSTRSAGISEASDPRESFDRWLEGQSELASEETLAAVREEAHSRIGAA